MASHPVSPDGQRLVEILADMLRSALALEEDHGLASEIAESVPDSPLTGMTLHIHCPQEQHRLRLIERGEENGSTDPDKER